MTSKAPFKITPITLFPNMFEALHAGITGRAIQNNLVEIACLNPRDEATRSHGYIDDKPYGGGPGMILQAAPILTCIRKAQPQPALRILMSPSGTPLTQQHIQHLSQQKHLIIVCGRYEGVDERIMSLAPIDAVFSIGDFIVSGGEIPAMALIDACIRQRPGSLGDARCAEEESFSKGLLEAPQYTHPKTLENSDVPGVLLSGHHGNIMKWQKEQSLARTLKYRPDLIEGLHLTSEDQALLERIKTNHKRGEQHERIDEGN